MTDSRYTVTYVVRWEVCGYGMAGGATADVYEAPADVAMAVAKALAEGAQRVVIDRRETPL